MGKRGGGKMRRNTSKHVSATVVAGLVLASLTVAQVSHASPGSVAEPGAAAPLVAETVWTGTISTTWTFVATFDGANPADGHLSYKTTGSATYASITSTGGRNYSAQTAIEGADTAHTDNGVGVTCDHATPFERTAFIDPDANEGVAPVMLDTEPDGTVFFTPGGIQINGVINSYSCSDGQAASGPTNTFQGTLLHGLQAAGALTDDTDPDPARLVGTMHWTKGNPPHPLPPDTDGHTTEYDFTATYDLTREVFKPACSDGRDNDGDGFSDTTDPGCDSPDDLSELSDAECDNGKDDDVDGRTDYRADGSGDLDCISLTDTSEVGDCTGIEQDTTKYRTITTLPGVPDAHWYTTTVTVTFCSTERGDKYVTGLDVDRHVESGLRAPIPLALSQIGLVGGIETAVDYEPAFAGDGNDPVAMAAARFTYTACFDLLQLLKIGKVQKYLKKQLQGPATKAIKKVLNKFGLKKITPHVRKGVRKEWNKTIHHLFDEGRIRHLLRKKFKMPNAIGALVERMVRENEKEWHSVLRDGRAATLLKTGELDGFTADAAAQLLVDSLFKGIGNAIKFCGGTTATKSHLLTWDATASVTAGRPSPSMQLSDTYLHPLMTVRED